MGGVLRVTFKFDEPFWQSKRFAAKHDDERLDAMAFVHTGSASPFPTWWTTYPVQAPLLVGWFGGPSAWELASASRDEIVVAAKRSLSAAFGMTRAAIDRHTRRVFVHNWNTDPFSRGAYSYVTVGGSRAAAQLARPIDRTVFVAGEHASSGRNGTVDGAIASGRRAARQVLQARS
jgi:monoamine oxidase